jgi:molybdopterin/thiamine biosynthesis adenylyltransferase
MTVIERPRHEHLTRQLDLIPIACLTTPITIIGAGAVGGWVALCLAKMGFKKIRVFDFDRVSIENMNSQFYRFDDIGAPKVWALKALIEAFTKTSIEARNEKYEGGMFPGIVISAVDSMAVRKLVWENHQGRAAATLAVIDPRMGAEEAQLYAMNPMSIKDIETYNKTLITDDQALEERCTAKATIHCATLLGGLVTQTVKDVALRKPHARVVHWAVGQYEQRCYKTSVASA